MSFEVVSKVETPEHRHVYGFLSVAVEPDGKLVIDKQGDWITQEDLEHTAKNFMLESRETGEMHSRMGVGRVFESMLLTPEKVAAMAPFLGVDPQNVPQGVAWWIGSEVAPGDDAWGRVKAGDRLAWSLGGYGRRIA